jgi:hypothetical protein
MLNLYERAVFDSQRAWSLTTGSSRKIILPLGSPRCSSAAVRAVKVGWLSSMQISMEARHDLFRTRSREHV